MLPSKVTAPLPESVSAERLLKPVRLPVALIAVVLPESIRLLTPPKLTPAPTLIPLGLAKISLASDPEVTVPPK